MPLSPYFLQGSSSEQRLVQDLINEQLKIYGQDVVYLPRKIINKKTIMKEVVASTFDDAFRMEAYLLNYTMTKTYLEDLSRIITPDTQIRFNKKQGRLYLDIDFEQMSDDTFIIIDGYRLLDPADVSKVYNDFWLKKYATALIKKQWGMNLIKFQGVMLPGGVALNGREIYEDAIRELEELENTLKTEYELPPLDFIG